MEEFRVATFNLENLDDKDPVEFKERLKVLTPMLDRINADILFLQEVNSLTALDELLKKTVYQGESIHKEHTVTTQGDPYDERNLVTISRYEIKKKKQYHHNLVDKPMWRKTTSKPKETEAKEIRWERPILHCEIDLGSDRTLHTLNLHLKSKNPTSIKGQQHPEKYWFWFTHEGWAEGYFLSAVKRLGQALETRILVEDLMKDDPLGTLLAIGGDFNAEIGSVPFKTIVGSIEDTSNPDLRATTLVPCEYNVPDDKRFSLIYHGENSMLDHVLVSRALYSQWLGTDIFNELLPDESVAFATDIKFPESDHAPVVARFKSLDNW